MTKPYHKHIRKKILSFLLLGTLLSLPVLLVCLFVCLFISYFGPINDGFPCVFTQLNILYNFSVFLRTFTDPRASCLSFFLSEFLEFVPSHPPGPFPFPLAVSPGLSVDLSAPVLYHNMLETSLPQPSSPSVKCSILPAPKRVSMKGNEGHIIE